mmetsp:Transcript_27589/g.56528  ORF Transcript_27589/g.56528 Transcript_27589/m.56528 type:complete len:266 (+) Transcript_27589:31-828(+)
MSNIGLMEEPESFATVPQGGAPLEGGDGLSSTAADSIPKHLLAQEVQKLRKEAATLKAAGAARSGTGLSEAEEMQKYTDRVSQIEREKQEFIERFNVEKQDYYKEIKELLKRRDEKAMEVAEAAQEFAAIEAPKPVVTVSADKGKDLAEALQRKKDFEENFTRTIRDLRKELEQSDLKQLSAKSQVPLGVKSLVQLGNERIEKVMEEASQVPVEERLHIETLRCLMENAKLRKLLNSYCEGLLNNTLSKAGPAPKPKSNKMFGVI